METDFIACQMIVAIDLHKYEDINGDSILLPLLRYFMDKILDSNEDFAIECFNILFHMMKNKTSMCSHFVDNKMMTILSKTIINFNVKLKLLTLQLLSLIEI
jgi:hypothetical protein